MRTKHMRIGNALITGALFLFLAAGSTLADVRIQCPANLLRDGGGNVLIDPATGQPSGATDDPNIVCRSLTAGDGFITMADGKPLYMFGFHDVTGLPADQVMDAGMLAQEFPAPTISAKEGQQVYLSLTNVGMVMRPDLFDPHSVHWHGFPNTASIVDGEPMASIAVNMGSTLTYFYVAPAPGTYMYHCHVEATEHMQMGMLGSLYVTPKQNGTVLGGCASAKYVYNDGDGSTCYDVEYPLQMTAMDSTFHDLHLGVQPLPFAMMKDDYPMLNGRGYPDTVNPNPLPAPADNGGKISQRVSSLITATHGQKVLLRISSLSTVDFFTLSSLSIPMKIVGKDAKILRSKSGQNLSYQTNSVTLGGGESTDVILDTAPVQPGTYYLYTTNMEHLNNGPEANGGIMTEIVIQ